MRPPLPPPPPRLPDSSNSNGRTRRWDLLWSIIIVSQKRRVVDDDELVVVVVGTVHGSVFGQGGCCVTVVMEGKLVMVMLVDLLEVETTWGGRQSDKYGVVGWLAISVGSKDLCFGSVLASKWWISISGRPWKIWKPFLWLTVHSGWICHKSHEKHHRPWRHRIHPLDRVCVVISLQMCSLSLPTHGQRPRQKMMLFLRISSKSFIQWVSLVVSPSLEVPGPFRSLRRLISQCH